MNNNEIFLEFWQNYQWSPPPKVVYRLYHDQQGCPIEYATNERSGQYIEITAEEYAMADTNVRVVDGCTRPCPRPLPPRLIHDTDHGVCCELTDVAVITTQDRPHQKWRLRNNDTD